MLRLLKSRTASTLLLSMCMAMAIMLLAQESTQAQNSLQANDITLIAANNDSNPQFIERKVTFGFGKGKPLANIVLGPFMYGYQKFISPQISAQCLYHPTCSEYGKHLFHTYGGLKAFLSTADRLMRCDRISATDIHEIDVDPHTHKKNETTDYYSFK
ncbi:MAG: membrane protein insertion efficiency factor YidD [Tenuifilaceae bacterium]|nr:membrane protein insertion efficiency factor YidD [Tenuifilaceae bacterium]